MITRSLQLSLYIKSFLQRWIALAALMAVPAVVPAQPQQSPASPAEPVLTEQQRAGKIVFLQNCTFCHGPKKQSLKSTVEGKTIGPLLNGLLTGPNAKSEQIVRTFILKGVQQKMPGFQYALEPKEIDNLIAYLKSL